MFRIMCPVGSATRAANTPGTADSTRTSNTTRAANTPDTADSTSTSNTTRAAYTTNSTNAANAANATDSSYAANATDSTNAAAVAPADVSIPIEIIVVINVDVIAAPTTTPTPAAGPKRSHHHAKSERNRRARGVVAPGRIVNRRIWIIGSAVHHHGIVRRYVHNLRISRFDYDDALTLDDCRLHLLLLVGFQIALILGFLAHPLNGIHHITLLRQKSVAQVGGPLNVICQQLYDLRQRGQSLHTRIP